MKAQKSPQIHSFECIALTLIFLILLFSIHFILLWGSLKYQSWQNWGLWNCFWSTSPLLVVFKKHNSGPRLAYLIVSSNIVPTAGHKNLVLLLSVLVLHSLVTRAPLNLSNFIIEHISPPKEPLPALLYHIVLYLLSIFSTLASLVPNEPSDSSSKPFHKRTVTKSLHQFGCAPLAWDSDTNSEQRNWCSWISSFG